MKSEAHQKGIYHASVHVWIYDNNGNILAQKRAMLKDTHPNHWDVSVAGHIAAGESPIVSAIREIKEKNLEEIGYFKSVFIHNENLKNLEYHYTYLCNYPIDIEKLIPQKEEVIELNGDLLFVPYGKEYYQFIINQIKKRTKNIKNG